MAQQLFHQILRCLLLYRQLLRAGAQKDFLQPVHWLHFSVQQFYRHWDVLGLLQRKFLAAGALLKKDSPRWIFHLLQQQQVQQLQWVQQLLLQLQFQQLESLQQLPEQLLVLLQAQFLLILYGQKAQ